MDGPDGGALHPKLRTMLDAAAHLPPLHTVPLADIRANGPARYEIGVPPDPVAGIEDRTIDGPGGPLVVRIYRPDGVAGLAPVVVFFHGGGFAICSIDTHTAMCRQICHRAGVVVVSVDYRMAPEHRFPAAPDDCLAATRWVAHHAAAFGGDPARLAVAGDSAGGNLAAVTALRARDEGGPAIAAQLLIYPVTDHYRAGHPSFASRGQGFGLTDDAMRWFWDMYLDGDAHGAHPHAAPLRADSLAGLPAACIVTAGFDPLRDEGDAYAERLRAAGVAVEHAAYADMNHGFFAWVGLVDRSTEAMDAACAWLRRTLQERTTA